MSIIELRIRSTWQGNNGRCRNNNSKNKIITMLARCVMVMTRENSAPIPSYKLDIASWYAYRAVCTRPYIRIYTCAQELSRGVQKKYGARFMKDGLL